MIFLSAQPDTIYFTWQLEIQLRNFTSLSISREKVHVLFSYDPKKGLSYKAKDLIKNYSEYAEFYVYPDERLNKDYLSTIRPHIIRQHFLKYEYLKNENIFYHDSDIVFTDKLPDFDKLNKGDLWYFSDTRSYLSASFIINTAGRLAFEEMCNTLTIDPSVVIENDNNSGGAQALIKKVDHQFWERMELDCVNLFSLLEANKERYKADFDKFNTVSGRQYTPLVSWCADMWALLWNSFKISNVCLDASLDFCWPENPVILWEKMNIFHNAGVTSEMAANFFFKTNFVKSEPFDTDFSFVSPDHCGYKYLQKLYNTSEKVYDASDVTFLITIRIEHPDRLENLRTVISFIKKHFRTNISILESDKVKRIPEEIISLIDNYSFIYDEDRLFNREMYSNSLAKAAKTPIIVKYDCDVIIPPAQFYNGILAVRYLKSSICYPYDGVFLNISGVLRDYFVQNLDIKLVLKYLPKDIDRLPSYGGCVILDREAFEKIGFDNENFKGWGFEDQELHKRSLILGLNFDRIDGPLIHLEHFRGKNSSFFNAEEKYNSYREYVKVCNMEKKQLLEYIKK